MTNINLTVARFVANQTTHAHLCNEVVTLYEILNDIHDGIETGKYRLEDVKHLVSDFNVTTKVNEGLKL